MNYTLRQLRYFTAAAEAGSVTAAAETCHVLAALGLRGHRPSGAGVRGAALRAPARPRSRPDAGRAASPRRGPRAPGSRGGAGAGRRGAGRGTRRRPRRGLLRHLRALRAAGAAARAGRAASRHSREAARGRFARAGRRACAGAASRSPSPTTSTCPGTLSWNPWSPCRSMRCCRPGTPSPGAAASRSPSWPASRWCCSACPRAASTSCRSSPRPGSSRRSPTRPRLSRWCAVWSPTATAMACSTRGAAPPGTGRQPPRLRAARRAGAGHAHGPGPPRRLPGHAHGRRLRAGLPRAAPGAARRAGGSLNVPAFNE